MASPIPALTSRPESNAPLLNTPSKYNEVKAMEEAQLGINPTIAARMLPKIGRFKTRDLMVSSPINSMIKLMPKVKIKRKIVI